MLQSLWESVKVKEDKGTIASLTESMYKAVKCVRIINEKADLPEQDLTKAVEMLSKAKRSLAALQKLPDGEDKRKHVKRVEDNIEKIHTFVNRIVQQQVDMENEELDAFDVDEYFNNKGAMEDPCSCNGGDAIEYENEEVGVAYQDPNGEFSVIRGRSGRYKAMGKGQFKGAVEPKVFDDLESAIRHGEHCCSFAMEDEESCSMENEEMGVSYRDPEERFVVIRGRSGRYKAVGKGDFRGEIAPRAFDHVEDAIEHASHECEGMMAMEDEEGTFKDKYTGRVNQFRKTKDGHREFRQHIKGRPSKWKRTTKDWAAQVQKDSTRMEDEEAREFDMDDATLAPDWQQRKDAATRDEFGTGYARADDDHLSYQGGEDSIDDMKWIDDPEVSRDYGDEFDTDDIMMKGDREYDHDADASFNDELTDEEGGEWMDVADPETADDDYHENEEQKAAMRKVTMRKLKKKLLKRAGMEDEESCSRRRMRESVERSTFLNYLVNTTK